MLAVTTHRSVFPYVLCSPLPIAYTVAARPLGYATW